MSLAITRQSVRSGRKGALFTGLGLSFFAFIFAAVHEQMKDDISTFTNAIPAGFEAFIGDMANAVTPEGWLSIELFALFVPMALAILGITIGSKIIGQEEESGTLELLLSRPVSRQRIVAEKALALSLILTIPAVLLWFGVFVGTLVFPFDVNLMHVAAAAFSAWLFGLGFGMVSLAAHAISGRRGIAVAIGAGLLGLTWILDIVAKLISSLENFKYASPLYYFNNPDTLTSGLDVQYAAVLVAIVLVGYVLAHLGFARRDIAS